MLFFKRYSWEIKDEQEIIRGCIWGVKVGTKCVQKTHFLLNFVSFKFLPMYVTSIKNFF